MTPIIESIHAVLWDLDGTLLDSRELHWLSWRESLAAEGYELTEAEFARTFGQRNDLVIPGFLGPDVPPAEVARIADAKEALYRRMVRRRGSEMLPGVETWLSRLRAAGWRQALATSAPRKNVDTIMEVLGIAPYFTAIVASEDVTHGKPDPEVFLTAARRLGAPVYRCVVVEDARAGVAAARAAGMRSIGVGPAHASLNADLSVPSLAALPDDAFERVLAMER